MGGQLSTNNPTIVSAFRSALLHQALVLIVIVALLAVAWNLLRSAQLRQARRDRDGGGPAGGAGTGAGPSGSGGSTGAQSGRRSLFAAPADDELGPEPAARRLLRVGFGLLWIFDGILQAQASMPLGLISQVVQPSAAGSPGWVHRLVNAGATIWTNHPITAASATVWIQIGLGLWLLVAPRGRWSQAGGLTSAGWGVLVWVFGESFGSIFAPGLTWLFGAPGAAVFYTMAGLLIALPETVWRTRTVGRVILTLLGGFFIGMAVLQAWPGRGFWQGRYAGAHGTSTPGSLTAMVQSMSQTPQPHVLASLTSSFASFVAAHGFAVNLFTVVVLAAIGVGLCSWRPAIVKWAVVAGIVVCLADWVLVEDLGFLGGVGTDPNSMVPMLLVFTAGYLAIAKVPAVAEATEPAEATAPIPIDRGRRSKATWRERLAARPVYALRALAALGAIAVVLLGAAPMAAASVNPNADAIVSEAVDGTPQITDAPAPDLHLVNQEGRPVSFAGFSGKVVALTFLDPVCTTDCPFIAQEFLDADRALGESARDVEFVAVVANPIYRSVAAVQAFDRAEGLEHVANWNYLTGTKRQLEDAWNRFGVAVAVENAGSMVAHSDVAYIIDRTGHTRVIMDADPGPATATTKSSFTGVLTTELRNVLALP